MNEHLAKHRGLTKENCSKIQNLHAALILMISEAVKFEFSQEIYDEIESIEYELQEAWGFSKDSEKHVWKKAYKFKSDWVGRRFKCLETGKQFTIPKHVEECDFYAIGTGFVDVGRFGFYSRFSGVIEIDK